MTDQTLMTQAGAKYRYAICERSNHVQRNTSILWTPRPRGNHKVCRLQS